MTGVPLIVEVNAPFVEDRRDGGGGVALAALARWSEGVVLRSADYVLPVSHVLAGLLRRAGVPDDRIVVVPNGVDPARFAAVPAAAAERDPGLPAGRLVLGFTGFVRAWHRLDRAVDLLARGGESAEDLHLLVVGHGPACEDLRRRAAARGAADRVTITGPVDRASVAGYVAAFDVALLPGATAYASPLKIFEYMALGRPIVAPDAPNIREVLADGETALLFDPGAAGSFEGCVARLRASPALRTRLGAAARRAVVERGFTWERNARRIEELIRRLHHARRSAAPGNAARGRWRAGTTARWLRRRGGRGREPVDTGGSARPPTPTSTPGDRVTVGAGKGYTVARPHRDRRPRSGP